MSKFKRTKFDKMIFDQSEIEFFEKKYELYKTVHGSYINDENGPYVYGCTDDWIIVYEKISITKTNENRTNIVCHKYAEYTADKLRIVLMFDKFNPYVTTRTHMSLPEICSIVHYQQDQILESKDFRLNYFKSIIVPYFLGLLDRENRDNHEHRKCCKHTECVGYSGFYVGWYDTGYVSEKGYYNCGKRTGVWKFGSIVTKPTDVHINDFDIVEYENDNIKKTIHVGNSQIVVYNKPIVGDNTNTYVEVILNKLYEVAQYADCYIPDYLSKYWKIYIKTHDN